MRSSPGSRGGGKKPKKVQRFGPALPKVAKGSSRKAVKRTRAAQGGQRMQNPKRNFFYNSNLPPWGTP